MTRFIFLLFFMILFTPVFLYGQGEIIEREANDTLTPVEMNTGDTLKFKLLNGEVRTVVLNKTSADVIITNVSELKNRHPASEMLYHFTAELVVDGHPMTMERYVASQESFYEPYVINGMRIWFDGVTDILEIIDDIHRSETFESGDPSCECLPNKDARFAFMDMTGSIAPEKISPWYDNKTNFIDISDSFTASNPWMGAHRGVEIHGALDINFPAGTPNYSPISIDNHYLFNTITDHLGSENNRWRGIRKWDNGDIWTIQVHHLLYLRVPEHTPIEAGAHYADAGGVYDNALRHGHYVFRIKTPDDEDEIWLDPWIIFWQTFEDNKARAGEIKAAMPPFTPHYTGESVAFSSEGSRSGVHRSSLSYYWTFGDGGWSNEENPQYTYSKPGIYPVTLIVDDGAQKDSFTQHITIDGVKVDKPALTLMAEDEPSFLIRPAHAMDLYGLPVKMIPHSLHFVARETRPKPNRKVVKLHNNGTGVFANIQEPGIHYYSEGGDWLSVGHEGEGNNQQLNVEVDATGLEMGVYKAKVQVESENSLNNIQEFLVQVTIPSHPPLHIRLGNADRVVVHHSDTRYSRFYSTPYFWVGPQFHRWDEKGYGEYYLTNGGRAKEGEFARFTPDLEEGQYEVSFAVETPFDPERRAKSQPVNTELNPESRFAVRVNSKDDDQLIWVEPAKSLVIGTFEFYEGMDGFVDILAAGSTGQVLVDAIVFKKID